MQKLIHVVLALLAVNVVQAQTQQLPAAISNEQFRQMFVSFSEQGGSFSSDNFTSNEITIGQLATELRARGRTGGVYIGVGPEQNFTYIAALKPQIAFITDIRRQAVLQHLMFKALFELSNNRSEFVSRLFSRPMRALPLNVDVDSLFIAYGRVGGDTVLFEINVSAITNQLVNVRGLSLSSNDQLVLRNVYRTFFDWGPQINYSSRVGSTPSVVASRVNFATLASAQDSSGVKTAFLGSEENFQYLKNLHQRNLIVPLVGDFGGTQALRMIGDYMRERNLVLSAYYTSNVEQYLFRSTNSWRQYYANVAAMPLDSMSIFIRPSVFSVGGSVQTSSSLANGISTANSLPGLPASPPSSTLPTPPTPPNPPQVAQISPPGVSANMRDRGTVAGIVVDTAGRALASALVSLAGTSFGSATGPDGQFAILNVPSGVYNIAVRRVGFAPFTSDTVRIAPNTTSTLSFRLTPMPITLSVVIQGRPPAGQGLNTVQLCPAAAFLSAYSAGKVLVYGDAVTCVRQ